MHPDVPWHRVTMPRRVEVEFVILSRYDTFQPESWRTRAQAEARLERIAEMDPVGYAEGAYWITSYEQ